MFLDYFATGKLDVVAATAVVKGIAEGCKQAGAALVGGESALGGGRTEAVGLLGADSGAHLPALCGGAVHGAAGGTGADQRVIASWVEGG
jgi:hypothetical protein